MNKKIPNNAGLYRTLVVLFAELNWKDKNKQSCIAEITELLDGIKNRTMEYDDRLVRQIIEAIIVESKEKIKVIFIGGYEIEQVI